MSFLFSSKTLHQTLSLDLNDFGIISSGRTRMICLSDDLISSIHKVLNEELNNRSNQILYNLGKEFGLVFFNLVKEKVFTRYPNMKNISDIPIRTFLSVCDSMWAEHGFGHFDVINAYERIFINLYNSPYAQALGQVTGKVDEVFCGMFSSLFSKLSKSNLECTEIMCCSNGHTHCCFFVAEDKEVLKKISEMQSSKASYGDIIKFIKSE